MFDDVDWKRWAVVAAPVVVGLVISWMNIEMLCLDSQPGDCVIIDYRVETALPTIGISVLVAIGLWFVTRRRDYS